MVRYFDVECLDQFPELLGMLIKFDIYTCVKGHHTFYRKEDIRLFVTAVCTYKIALHIFYDLSITHRGV